MTNKAESKTGITEMKTESERWNDEIEEIHGIRPFSETLDRYGLPCDGKLSIPVFTSQRFESVKGYRFSVGCFQIKEDGIRQRYKVDGWIMDEAVFSERDEYKVASLVEKKKNDMKWELFGYIKAKFR